MYVDLRPVFGVNANDATRLVELKWVGMGSNLLLNGQKSSDLVTELLFEIKNLLSHFIISLETTKVMWIRF